MCLFPWHLLVQRVGPVEEVRPPPPASSQKVAAASPDRKDRPFRASPGTSPPRGGSWRSSHDPLSGSEEGATEPFVGSAIAAAAPRIFRRSNFYIWNCFSSLGKQPDSASENSDVEAFQRFQRVGLLPGKPLKAPHLQKAAPSAFTSPEMLSDVAGSAPDTPSTRWPSPVLRDVLTPPTSKTPPAAPLLTKIHLRVDLRQEMK